MDTVLDNDTLSRLVRNPVLVAQFPFMATARNGVLNGGGGCCGRGGVDWNELKRNIALLPDEAKRRFKAAVGATTVSGHYRSGGTVASFRF